MTDDNWKKNLHIAQSTAINDSSSTILLPYMLDKYSSIYNKNGRIGVYSREERDVIIARFHAKRRRRVWKKSIRYHCRKNLADRRVRVKGRFVRASLEEEKKNNSGSNSSQLISGSSVTPSPVIAGKSSSSSSIVNEKKKEAVGRRNIGLRIGTRSASKASSSSSNLDELVAIAEEEYEEEDDSHESEEEEKEEKEEDQGLIKREGSYPRSRGLELLEQAIQFDDEDSKLPPGKRMRRHTIV